MTAPSKATVQDLIARAKKENSRRLDARQGMSRWCPNIVPTPKQLLFLNSNADEVLYGGAASGGKTQSLLMSALQHVDEPNYACLILRRTYSDLVLPGAIQDRCQDWLRGTAAVWNDSRKTFTFPSGASISFGYCQTDQDRFRYAGTEIQQLCVDELTQFTEKTYTFLQSRLRRNHGNKVKPVSRTCSNPGSTGHKWVFERFVQESTRAQGADFISAKLDDNPHVDHAEYRKALARLDPTTRAQLERGEWITDANGQLYAFDLTRNRIDHLPVLPNGTEYSYVLGIDLGASQREATTSFAVLCWSEHDPVTYVLMSFKESGIIPSTLAERIQALSLDFPFERIVIDAGGLGIGYVNELQTRWSIPCEAVQKQNRLGYQKLFSGALSKGHVKLLTGQNDDLEDELLSLQYNSEGTRQQDGATNHVSDATLYAWRSSNAHQAEGYTEHKDTLSNLPRGSQSVRDNAEYIREQARESRRKAEERSSKRANRRWFER